MKTALALSPTRTEFAPLFYAGDLTLGLQKAAEYGYDGVELNLRDSDELDQEELLAQLSRFSLSVPSIGTGQSFFTDRISLADTDQKTQTSIRERMRGHVRFASKVKAMVVIGSVRGVMDTQSAERRQACMDMAVEATRDIARFASGLNVRLTIEPINRFETNLINTVEQAVDFINRVGEENVGIVLDTFHMNIEEPSIYEGFSMAGGLLWHVHLVDSNRLAPGMGHLDIEKIIKTLGEIGYDQYLSAEVVPQPIDDIAATKWMSVVRPLIQP